MNTMLSTGSESLNTIISVPPKAVEKAKEFASKQIEPYGKDYGVDIRTFQSDVRTIQRVYVDVLLGKLGEMAVAYLMGNTFGHYVKLDLERRYGGDLGDLLHYDGSTPPIKVDVKTVPFGHKWLLVPVRLLSSDWYIAVQCLMKSNEIENAKGDIKFQVYSPIRRNALAVRDDKGKPWFLFHFPVGSYLLETVALMMIPEVYRKPIHIDEVRLVFEKQSKPISDKPVRGESAGIPLNWLSKDNTQQWEEFIREFYPNPPEYGKQQRQG